MSGVTCAPRPQSAGGFTLVEVMISLSLLALIMLGLVSAMATFGDTATKLDQRVGRSSEVRLVSAFLHAALSQSSKVLKYKADDGRELVYFGGTGQDLRWLGNMPARHGAGGLHHFRLLLSELPPGPALLLQYLPFVDNQTLPDWSVAAEQTLVERVGTFRLAYESKPVRPDEAPEWFDFWAPGERLPGRVRLELSADGRPWPPVWVGIHAPDTGGATRIVHGPGS